jgi:hypothetical protein
VHVLTLPLGGSELSAINLLVALTAHCCCCCCGGSLPTAAAAAAAAAALAVLCACAAALRCRPAQRCCPKLLRCLGGPTAPWACSCGSRPSCLQPCRRRHSSAAAPAAARWARCSPRRRCPRS